MSSFAFLRHDGPIAMAHRGGMAETHENTMEGFRHAVNLGFQYIELDVRATSDGELYVWHGASSVRRTRQPMDLDHLAEKEKDRLPLLIDVLKEFPDVKFHIDPKNWPAVEPLAQVIADTKAVDRVCIGAFSENRTRKVAQLILDKTGRHVCTTMGARGNLSLMMGSRLARATSKWRSSFACSMPPVRAVSKPFINTAHASGVKIIPWTVNSEKDMNRLLDMGVDGLTTDYPSRLKKVLQARGQWA